MAHVSRLLLFVSGVAVRILADDVDVVEVVYMQPQGVPEGRHDVFVDGQAMLYTDTLHNGVDSIVVDPVDLFAQ